MTRGSFIVFEGADRSGKTTQTKRCIAALKAAGIKVIQDGPWRFPDRTTPIGEMINSYLTKSTDIDDRGLHLLFSANRWEKMKQLQDALNRGETVIVDRYAYSGVAYSVAKGLPLDWCKKCDEGLPAPDVIVYLDLSIEKASQRGDYGKERYENQQMQQAVAKVFNDLRTSSWKIIDADADEDIVFQRVMDAVMSTVTIAQSDHINTLWKE